MTVTGKDLAGNPYAGPESISFAIDNTPPAVTLTSDHHPELLVRNADSVVIRALFDGDMESAPTISIAGSVGSFVVAAPMCGDKATWSYTWDVPAGHSGETATATVAGKDLAGNAYAGPESIVHTIDDTAPTVTLHQPNGGEYWAGKQEIKWTASDGIGMDEDSITLYYSDNDGLCWTSLAAGETNDGIYEWNTATDRVHDGEQYRVRVEATDKAGNVCCADSSGDFTVENTPPAVSIRPSQVEVKCPGWNPALPFGSLVLHAEVAPTLSPIESFLWKLDGTTVYTGPSSSFTAEAPGEYSVTASSKTGLQSPNAATFSAMRIGLPRDGLPGSKLRIDDPNPLDNLDFGTEKCTNQVRFLLNSGLCRAANVENWDKAEINAFVPSSIATGQGACVYVLVDGVPTLPVSFYIGVPPLLLAESFDGGNAPGWSLESGWVVRQPDEVPNLDLRSPVLAGAGHFGATYPPGMNWEDYRLRFRLCLLEGTIHVNTRVVLSSSAGHSRYFAGIRGRGIRLSKTVTVDGHEIHTEVASVDRELEYGIWYDVEVSCVRNEINIAASREGRVVAELSYSDDDSPLLSGTITFETLDNSSVYIDDVCVEEVCQD